MYGVHLKCTSLSYPLRHVVDLILVKTHFFAVTKILKNRNNRVFNQKRVV